MTENDFKLGDEITILKQPYYWSSLCADKNPLESDEITYPYTCTIVILDELHEYLSMKDNNGYGWSMNSLVDQKLIATIKQDRRIKLSKIKMIYNL